MLGLLLAELCWGWSMVCTSSGIVGNFLTILLGNIGVAKSIMGELTDSTNRAKAFSLFGFCMAIGCIVGPMIGGFLANPADKFSFLDNPFFRTFPYFLPCFISSLVSFAGFILGYFYLEETLDRTVVVVHVGGEKKEREGTKLPKQAHPAVLGLGLLALTSIIAQETYPLLAASPVDIERNGLGFNTNELGMSLMFSGCVTLFCQVRIHPTSFCKSEV